MHNNLISRIVFYAFVNLHTITVRKEFRIGCKNEIPPILQNAINIFLPSIYCTNTVIP